MRALELIAGVREQVNALRTYTPTIDEVADASGMVREIEVNLQEWRHEAERIAADHQPEVTPKASPKRLDKRDTRPPAATGQHWELVPEFRTRRIFNFPRILNDIASAIADTFGADVSIGQVIQRMEKAGAISVTFKVTKLQTYAKAVGLTINEYTSPPEDEDRASIMDAVEGGDMEAPHIIAIKTQSGMKRVPLS